MPLNTDRNTPYMDAEILTLAVAAGAEIFMGALVCANAAGYVVPGTEATDLTYLGRADAHIDNTDGADGDVVVPVRYGKGFRFANSGTDPVGQALLGKPAYIVDDETVAGTDGTGTRSESGIVVGIDDAGVWIK